MFFPSHFTRAEELSSVGHSATPKIIILFKLKHMGALTYTWVCACTHVHEGVQVYMSICMNVCDHVDECMNGCGRPHTWADAQMNATMYTRLCMDVCNHVFVRFCLCMDLYMCLCMDLYIVFMHGFVHGCVQPRTAKQKTTVRICDKTFHIKKNLVLWKGWYFGDFEFISF